MKYKDEMSLDKLDDVPARSMVSRVISSISSSVSRSPRRARSFMTWRNCRVERVFFDMIKVDQG